MESIKNFIFNKKNLVLFYFEVVIFQTLVLRMFVQESGYFYYRTNLIFIALNALWVFLLIGYDIKHKKINFKDKKLFFLFLFLIIATIDWIVSLPSHGIYIDYIHEIIKLYEFAYIFYSYSSESNLEEVKQTIKILAYSYCAYIFVYCVISLVIYFLGYTEIMKPNGTLHILYANDNPVAHKDRYMGLWTWAPGVGITCYPAICLHLYLIENKKNKFINILGIILSTYMIYLSDSRGALVVLAFIVLAYFLFILVKKMSIKKVIRIGILVGIIGGLALISLKFLKNQELLSEFISNPIDTIVTLSSGRIQMAIGVIKHQKETWLFGEGYSNNGFIINTYGNIHPHNVIMAALLYTGIPGTLVYLILAFLLLKEMFSNLDSVIKFNIKWLFVLTLCVMIGAMFDTEILGSRNPNLATLFFYICLGISVNKELE